MEAKDTNRHKKNIMLLIPELGPGGAERSISQLSMQLAKMFNVVIVVFSNTDIYYEHGGKLIVLQKKSKSSKMVNWFLRIREVRQIKKNLKINASISYLEGANYLNVLTKINDKVIISVRGSLFFDKEITGFKGFVRKHILIPILFKRADSIVAVSKAIVSELIEKFRITASKIEFIPNFYRVEKINKLAKEPFTSLETNLLDKPFLLTSGRLHIQKEHQGLIYVFACVVKALACRLVILGDGLLRHDIVNLANSLGLIINELDREPFNNKAQVFLLGYISNPFKFMRAASLYAMSSSWEGFPNALAEAMLCGCPVVTTDCPTGPREILDIPISDTKQIDMPFRTDYGTLMPLLNTYDEVKFKIWAKEILYYLENPQVAELTGRAGSKRISTYYNAKDEINHWLNVI